ncbi:ICAM5 protein, partial [Pitta sordida]|nr:ICAM5 protein [Pitta sordida]
LLLPVPALPAVKPRLEDGSCPRQQNWTEGQDGTLQCRAKGNPEPRVECTKDGQPFPAETPRPISRDHNGTYHCRATNELGTDERSIIVWVHCEWGGSG